MPSWTDLSHRNHVVERLETRIQTRVRGLRIEREEEHRDMVVAAQALQNGHHVDVRGASRTLEKHAGCRCA